MKWPGVVFEVVLVNCVCVWNVRCNCGVGGVIVE